VSDKWDEWCSEFPAKEGRYWFYGDPYFGNMRSDFKDDPEIDMRLYLIDVRKISNGWMCVTDGQFIPTNMFKKGVRKPGYLGFWRNAVLPTIPESLSYGVQDLLDEE